MNENESISLIDKMKEAISNAINAENCAIAWKQMAREELKKANILFATAEKLDGQKYDRKAVFAAIRASFENATVEDADATAEQPEVSDAQFESMTANETV